MKTKTDLKKLSKYKIRNINAADIINHIPAALTCEDSDIAILTSSPVGSVDGSVWYRDVNRRECGYIQDMLSETKGCLQVKLGINRHESSVKDLNLYISKP